MTDEINLEDIVVLKYAQNPSCLQVIKVTDKGLIEPKLSIDVKLGIWNYGQWSQWKNIPIGNARSEYNITGNIVDYGIIGVYDIKNFEHIESMVSAAVNFTNLPQPGDFFEN